MFKLFGKVMQTNKSINKEGIGLGLYITKNLAVELGGNITLDSVVGVYTRFLLTLPVKQFYRRVKTENNSSTSNFGVDVSLQEEKMMLGDIDGLELHNCCQKEFKRIIESKTLDEEFFN